MVEEWVRDSSAVVTQGNTFDWDDLARRIAEMVEEAKALGASGHVCSVCREYVPAIYRDSPGNHVHLGGQDWFPVYEMGRTP